MGLLGRHHESINLNNRSWGLFRPRRNITCHYFLIGWTYSFVVHNIWCVNMSHTSLYANAPKHPRRCDGVRYAPKTYVGVKKDPRTCLTWLFLDLLLGLNGRHLYSSFLECWKGKMSWGEHPTEKQMNGCYSCDSRWSLTSGESWWNTQKGLAT